MVDEMPYKNEDKRKDYMKKYHAGYDASYYQKNKDKRKKQASERRKLIRTWFNEYKSRLSCPCGEDHPACLEFHHNGDDKKYDVSSMINRGYSIKTISEEIEKCNVLCANCHRKLHHEIGEGL